MKAALAVLILACSTVCFADDHQQHQPSPPPPQSTAVIAVAAAAAGASSTVKDSGNSQQKQGQQQSQSQQMNGSGNSTSTSTANGNGDSNGNGSNDTNIDYRNPRQTATAIAPAQFPSASCFKTYGGAGQGPAFGFSVGAGRIDRDCSARELARSFMGINNPTAAARILCSTADAKRAKLTLEQCLAIAQPAPVFAEQNPTPAAAPPVIVTNPTPNITVNIPAPVVQAAQITPAAPAAATIPVTKARHHVTATCPCGAEKLKPNPAPRSDDRITR